MSICTAEDEYTQSLALTEARWVATLNSGLTVYQDDARPGLEVESAWLRLKEFLQSTGDYITALRIEFRSHVERPVPDHAEGYFFRRSAIGCLTSQTTKGFFLVGHLQKSEILVQRWSVPELILVEKEVRDPTNEELVGPSLIRKVSS